MSLPRFAVGVLVAGCLAPAALCAQPSLPAPAWSVTVEARHIRIGTYVDEQVTEAGFGTMYPTTVSSRTRLQLQPMNGVVATIARGFGSSPWALTGDVGVVRGQFAADVKSSTTSSGYDGVPVTFDREIHHDGRAWLWRVGFGTTRSYGAADGPVRATLSVTPGLTGIRLPFGSSEISVETPTTGLPATVQNHRRTRTYLSPHLGAAGGATLAIGERLALRGALDIGVIRTVSTMASDVRWPMGADSYYPRGRSTWRPVYGVSLGIGSR
jgi:hypothetical protein